MGWLQTKSERMMTGVVSQAWTLTMTLLSILFALGAAGPAARAQEHGAAASQASVSASGTQPVDTVTNSAQGTLIDQVLAVVNGDLILESDVNEERRFAAFEPLRDEVYSRDATVERLIDQALILEQAKLQPDDQVERAEAEARLASLRKEIPACKQAHCETDAGWAKFVADQGFTMNELLDELQKRMEILKFVEIRFRSGILIDQAQIKTYYDNTLLPEYARRHATAPPLDALKSRIQEILLQQQVSNLLGDWLKTLKAEGSVRVVRPGEVQP